MDFCEALLEWYEAHGRTLPWRGTKDPYRVWLSEVMLQQTQVAQAEGYYRRFTDACPAVEDLAEMEEDDVMRLWQGLGYYSRCRNLHRAAKQIAAHYAGGNRRLSYEEWRALPGVGDYTAAAVTSIVWGERRAAIDGNLYRVLSRVFRIDTPIDRPGSVFRELAAALLDEGAEGMAGRGWTAGEWNQAMMDLGATVCTPKNPRCADCPLEAMCLARAEGVQDQLPRKASRVKVTERTLRYLIIENERGEMLLHRRTGRDIWQGLWEPLEVAASHRMKPEHVVSHRLTHRLLRIEIGCGTMADVPRELTEDWRWVPREELVHYALPKPFTKVLPQE